MTSDEREESSHSSVGTSESFRDLISLLPSRVESSRQTPEEDGYREVSQPSWERGGTKRKWEGREGKVSFVELAVSGGRTGLKLD